MRMVINCCYGGYGLSEECLKYIGVSEENEIERSDSRLLAFIKEFGAEAASASYSDLAVVEVPDEATDWMLDEYDGAESVIYVLDGKLHWAVDIDDEDD